MTCRAVKEWIGATPDAKIPRRVKLRILDRYDWKCYKSKVDLRHAKFDFDHIKALVNGGQHRESNIAPLLRILHKQKTAEDVTEKAAMAAKVAHHYDLDEPASRAMPLGRESPFKARIGGGIKLRNQPVAKPPLPRRDIYQETT